MTPAEPSAASAVNRAQLARRGQRLEYFTIAWNILEGMAAIVAGVIAGSVSLVGFGIDSAIEVTSGAALLWRMNAELDAEAREQIERLSLRIVGASFLTLAGYVAYEATRDLIGHELPQRSVFGIGLAAASLVVMPLLSRAKRRVGSQLGSAAMAADAQQTQFCAYLSAILLGGLVLNALFGLWWADPAAALVMAPIIAHEGVESVRGEKCCD